MVDLPPGFRVVQPAQPTAPQGSAQLPAGFRVVQPSAPPADAMAQFSDLPYPGNPNFDPEANGPGTWRTGDLAPVAVNEKTGEFRPAVPRLVSGAIDAAVDAFTLPGDVMAGREPGYTPGGDIPQALTGRTLNFSMFPQLGATGAPAATPILSEASKGIIRQADELGIPLSTAQKTGDLPRYGSEEALRQMDTPAQPIMRTFDERQKGAIESAVGDIGQSVGGNADDLAGAVTTGLQDRVNFSKERAASLYKIAEDGDLVIDASAVQAMPDFVKQRIVDSPIIMDQNVTPTAVAAWRLVEEAGANAGTLNTSLKGIEQIRKRLVGLNGNSPEDRAATMTVKKAFDEWVDSTIDQALYSGDETALNALKAARAESQNYLRITSPKSGDAAGAVVKKMQAEDVTSEQVANWLYGADIVSPNLNSPQVAARIKGILGADSPEWQAVRAAAFKRLVTDLGTGEVRSPALLIKRIDNFLNNKGGSLSQVLFSEGERNRLKALSTVLKRTVTPADAKNPSRTAWALGKVLGGSLAILAGGVGYGVANVGGLAAMAAVPIFRNMRRVGAAKKAVAGKLPEQVPEWAKVLPAESLAGLGMFAANPDNKPTELPPIDMLMRLGA